MDHTVRTEPVSDDWAGATGERLLQLDVFSDGDSCLVRAAGELARSSRDELVAVSTAGDHGQVTIDLSAVTFMDCSGYGGLVAARLRIERDGRTFAIRGITGQPKLLLDTIEQLQGSREV